MTDKDRKFKEAMEEVMKQNFMADKALAPTVFIDAPEGLVIMAVGPLMDSPNGKDVLAMLVKRVAREKKAERVMFITEAWASMVGPGDKNPIEKYGAVRNDPKKVEIVMQLLWTREATYNTTYRIDRSGTVPQLTDRQEYDNPISKESSGVTFVNPFYNPPWVN